MVDWKHEIGKDGSLNVAVSCKMEKMKVSTLKSVHGYFGKGHQMLLMQFMNKYINAINEFQQLL